MSLKKLPVYLLIALSSIFISCATAPKTTSFLKCHHCGKEIYGYYYIGEDKMAYCSEKCLSTTWLECYVCKNRIKEGVIISSYKDDILLCYNCKNLPKCFCCNSPKHTHLLSDGRYICDECNKSSITDINIALKIIDNVRSTLKIKFNLYTDHQIEYHLVDRKTLAKIEPSSNLQLELGLFKYEEATTVKTTLKGKKKIKEDIIKQQNFNIYILSHLPYDRFQEVVAHELAHDWMQEYYPNIKDLSILEGFAQYIAYQYNKISGYDYLAKNIENYNDPIYGGGFRKIKLIAEKGNNPIEEIKRYLDKNYKP